MIALYADTSAVAGAYLADEADHAVLTAHLFEGDLPVVTSELTRLEFTSAVTAAIRGGRLDPATDLLSRFDADCAEDGPLTLLRFEPDTAFPLAVELVTTHPLRSLDALHLAVALTAAASLADEVVVLTRDARQRDAAKARGLRTC